MIPRADASIGGVFRVPNRDQPLFLETGGTTNHLTGHFSIDLMPQWRHKKERFLPKGDECEPKRIAKSRGQIGRSPTEEFIQEKAGPHRATDRFQVLRLV